MQNIIPTPTKKKKLPPITDYSVLENFLAEHYAPTNIDYWNDFLLSKKQPECFFSDHSSMNVQEYIDTILSQMPDLSLATLDSLENTQRYMLADMLIRMNLDKLVETFGSYILLFIIFWSYHYGYGRFESYLEPYLHKHPIYTRNIWVNTLDMLREATHRMSLQSSTFGHRMLLFKFFASLQERVYQKEYDTILHKYITDPILWKDISIGHIFPRSKQPTWHSNWCWYETQDISKNEKYANKCYLDAPLALGLFYKWVPIAVIAGMLWNQNDFVIYQMQAISSYVYNWYGVTKGMRVNPITHTLPRQKILHECISNVAQKEWVKNVYILPSEKNKWTETMLTTPVWDEYEHRFKDVPIDVPHLSIKIAQQIYDAFAQKNWYHKDTSWFWVQSSEKGRKEQISRSKHLLDTP